MVHRDTQKCHDRLKSGEQRMWGSKEMKKFRMTSVRGGEMNCYSNYQRKA